MQSFADTCENRRDGSQNQYEAHVAKEMALNRLVAMLEAGGPHSHADSLTAIDERAKTLSRLARLQNARAFYVLETGGSMKREGAGAWIRSHRE